MFRSKFFWLNLIAVLILVIQYFITNQMFPAWAAYFALAVVVLNAIAGMIQSNQNAQLNIQNAALKARLPK